MTREKYDLSTEDGKKRYLQEAVAQVLGPLQDRIELDLYAGKLSEETGVGKESIMVSALRAASQAARQRRREEVRAQQEVMAARTVANPEKKNTCGPLWRRRASSPTSTSTRIRPPSWRRCCPRKSGSPLGPQSI